MTTPTTTTYTTATTNSHNNNEIGISQINNTKNDSTFFDDKHNLPRAFSQPASQPAGRPASHQSLM